MAGVTSLGGRWPKVFLLTVTFLTVLVCAGVYAGEPANGDELDITDAIELALAHDVAAHVAKLNMESARITYQRNMAVNLLSDSRYNRRSAEVNLRSAEITYAHRRADVAMNAVNQYFSMLMRDLGVQMSEAQREIARINFDSTERKAKLGTAGRLDVLDAQVELGRADMGLAQAMTNLTDARETFAATLGLSPQSIPPLNPMPALPKERIVVPDVDAAVEQALGHSTAFLQAEAAVELAKMEREQALAESVAPLDQQAAELKVRISELELEQVRRNVRSGVMAAYDELKRAWDALELEQIQLTLARERHALVQQQFAAGLRTQSESIAADVTLAQARQRELTARNNYFTAVLSFQKLMGVPVDEAMAAW